MKNKNLWMVLALAVALITPATAGEKCTGDTQTCLNMMAEKLANKGWIGVELDSDKETGALTIKLVVEDSPAQAAGFKPGDQLVAINGVVIADADEKTMKATWSEMKPGKVVTCTLGRGAKQKEVDVTLAKLPEDVMAKWIGSHMLEHATMATAQK
jgi:predicted metalloprotease with PDZ domain